MIFVSVGTVSYPFPRLIDAVITLPIQEPLIIQAGDNRMKKVSHIDGRTYIPLSEMIVLYEQAELVVSAAGEGSVMMMLQYCRNQPILFPRQKKYSEHVNDQQVEIARAVANKGWAKMAMNDIELGTLIRQPTRTNNYPRSKKSNSDVFSYLASILQA
jgi:UDP-N-acetylglucosamine transferase subunit ALG13